MINDKRYELSAVDNIDVTSASPVYDEPPIIGAVACIVCGEQIPLNAMQSFNVSRMCRACKQAVMAMRMQMEIASKGEQE